MCGIIQKNEINVGLVCVMKQELLAIRTRTEQSSCIVAVAVRSIKQIQRFVDLGPILKQNLESFKSCLNLNSMLVISTSLKISTSKQKRNIFSSSEKKNFLPSLLTFSCLCLVPFVEFSRVFVRMRLRNQREPYYASEELGKETVAN